MIGIGLDFGTTNSTIALFDGQNISYVEIDNSAMNSYVMPTALYLNRDYESIIGTKAIRQYLLENEGRNIELKKKELGEVKMTYAEIGTINVAVHANVDMDMPGHLFHGLKRWLGDESLEYIGLWDRDYRSVALITPILEYLKNTGKEHTLIDVPEIELYVEFSRDELNTIIAEILTEIEAGIDDLLKSANIHPSDVSVVVRTGGSSQIPIVHSMLDSRFPGKTVEFDFFRSIAAGLAIANYNNLNIC